MTRIWSSSGSTRSAISTSRGRWGTAPARYSSPAVRCGRAERFTGSEEERHAILRRALALGAEWVDLEWRGGFEALIAERHGRNIVLSMHDFDGTPGDLEGRYRAMRGTGAEIVKMAVRSRSAGEVVRLLRLGRASRSERLVLVGMGPAGVPTRLLPAHFGSCWTYAGEGVAPGQVRLSDMVGRYRFKRTSAATVVYGVAGAPIGHSLSPPMHNAGFEAAGLDARSTCRLRQLVPTTS